MILNYKITGRGRPIVLLHGMTGSLRYWDLLTPFLSKNHLVVSIDLLGFGNSPKPNNTNYDYSDHLGSIIETLSHIKIATPYTLVGHSMGALLALRLAKQYPEAIRHLVLIGMPIYQSPKEARKAITQSRIVLELMYYGPTSHTLCTVWCKLLRPISKHMAPLYLSRLPKRVAQDTLLHTWTSYSRSLQNIIESQRALQDLKALPPYLHVKVVYGLSDGTYIPERVSAIKVRNIEVITMPGTHQLPLEQPRAIAGIIQ